MKKSNEPIPKLRRLILELHKINSRLTWSVEIEENMIKNLQYFNGKIILDEDKEKLHIISNMFRVLFDYNIITLHNILEIQPTIEKILNQNGYSTLLDALKDSWNIINDEKKRIKKYRNLFVAHSLDNIVKFYDYPQLEEFDKDFQNASSKISIAVRCGLFYLSPIIHTFHDEWELGMLEYRQRGGKPDYTVSISKSFNEISNRSNTIAKKVSEQLMKNGYMPFNNERII